MTVTCTVPAPFPSQNTGVTPDGIGGEKMVLDANAIQMLPGFKTEVRAALRTIDYVPIA